MTPWLMRQPGLFCLSDTRMIRLLSISTATALGQVLLPLVHTCQAPTLHTASRMMGKPQIGPSHPFLRTQGGLQPMLVAHRLRSRLSPGPLGPVPSLPVQWLTLYSLCCAVSLKAGVLLALKGCGVCGLWRYQEVLDKVNSCRKVQITLIMAPDTGSLGRYYL